MKTKTKTIGQFVRANSITIDSLGVSDNPNMRGAREMDNWKVVLHSGNRHMETYFSKGSGHNGARPTAAEVLSCLASDSAGVAGAEDFAQWAADYGYTVGKEARRIYNTCLKQAGQLQTFLGSELYEELLYHTDRD